MEYAPQDLDKMWHGKYLYDNYTTNPQTGTGIGSFHEVTLSRNMCRVEIDGHQIGRGFDCYVKPTANPHIIEVIQLTKYEAFYEIHKDNKNKFYLKQIHYSYDKELHLLEKIE